MTDFRRKSDFNKKRKVSVGVFEVSGKDIIEGGETINLPNYILITGVQVVRLGGFAKANGKAKLSLGADSAEVTVIGNANTVVDVVAFNNKYYPSGAVVKIENGSTALDAGDNEGRIITIIQYIEHKMTTGAYTN